MRHQQYFNERVWIVGGMVLKDENHSTQSKKPIPVPLCPPQIPHGSPETKTVRGWLKARD